MKGFIEFVREQGVVGLAVGFILGGAISKVVSSIVTDLITPILGLVLGATGNLNQAYFKNRKCQNYLGTFYKYYN